MTMIPSIVRNLRAIRPHQFSVRCGTNCPARRRLSKCRGVKPARRHRSFVALVLRRPPIRWLAAEDAGRGLDAYLLVPQDGLQEVHELPDKLWPIFVVGRVRAKSEEPRKCGPQKNVRVKSDPHLPVDRLTLRQVLAKGQVAGLVRHTEGKRWIHILVAELAPQENLQHVPGASRLALLPTRHSGSVQPVLGREFYDVLGELIYLRLGHTTTGEKLLENTFQRTHAISHQEDLGGGPM